MALRGRLTGARGAGGGSPPTYPGAMSSYGATRAESVGEPVSQFAYMGAMEKRAFYNQQAKETTQLGKVE